MTTSDQTRSTALALGARLYKYRAEIIEQWYESQFGEALRRFPNAFAEGEDPAEVRASHLRPLVDFLAEYAITADKLYLNLYRDERRRYAPHREPANILRDYFEFVLSKDERVLLDFLGDCRDEASQWLAEVHAPLLDKFQGDTYRILTIGDCLLSEIQSFLNPLAREIGLALEFRYYYFSIQQGVNVARDGIAQAIQRERIDLVAASYLSYQGIPLYRSLLESADRATRTEREELISGIIGFMETHLRQIRELTDAPILLHNAGGIPLSRWRGRIPFIPPMSRDRFRALEELNAAIMKLSESIENCILIDETEVIRTHGARTVNRQVLPRRIGAGAQMHPSWFGVHLATRYAEVMRHLAAFRRTKLLLVDFDNTLWHGVMADGPVEHEYGRQQLLRRLKDQGLVLVAVSKNDPKNVRWEEMALKPEDFASLKISWTPKSESIKQTAAELNLGLDSFALIDDNPAERELVRLELPQVRLLDSTDLGTWKALELLFKMPNTRRTEEARSRTEMYREQTERAQMLNRESDYPALMAKLQLRAQIRPASREDIDRLLELVQRTNQFNTTTIRYSRGELEHMINSPRHQVLIGRLADKFGDLGVVAVTVVENSGSVGTLESFVMSCRAMGFGMEYAMLVRTLQLAGSERITAKFVSNGRNEPASALYQGAGFSEIAPGLWELPEGASIPPAPIWISID